MPQPPRIRRLSTKFLLLAVPVIVAAALLFFAVLVAAKSRDLQRQNLALAERQAERAAELLGYPLWNVDGAAIRAILAQLAQPERVHCVRLHSELGIEHGRHAGQCVVLPASLDRVEQPVQYLSDGLLQPLGRIEFHVDTTVEPAVLIDALVPLVYLLAVLVAALTLCVLLAFRWTILTPLDRVATSIRAYRQRGDRLPVDWDSADELGEFIHEFNDGLRRQEHAERGLQEQLNYQMALRNTLPTPFAFVDRSLQVFDANPVFHQELRLAAGEHPPALSSLLPDVDWAALGQLTAGGIHSQELSASSGPLAGRTFLLAASPYLNPEGGIHGYVLVLQDISARIANERALRRAVAETERALADLQRAQHSLVQSEKLASLGSLVAGIAHEINTPIGNSLTVATALGERVHALQREFAEGGLRRSMLAEFIDEADEACQILHRALVAAAEQIQKFKQVAVDQASSKRRRFDLRETIDEVVSTLRPQLRRTRHRLEITVPCGIELDSYPGPLGQVIVNCFNNALLHGFDGVDCGILSIGAEQPRAGRVRLTIGDSGRGIAQEHLDRVFDPFFTTRMGHGGSGLGLNLVYTIVTGLLGGQVDLQSAPDHGTRVVVDIPLSAPQDAHAVPEPVHVT
jgi:signal transduction histidine kinase